MKEGYVYIGENIFSTLIALSEKEQEQGLMWQEYPPPIMSFIYAYPKVNRFWMMNTPSPLDIVFSCHGEITYICQGIPFSMEALGNFIPSDLVVELPQGMVDTLNIKVGQKIGLIRS